MICCLRNLDKIPRNSEKKLKFGFVISWTSFNLKFKCLAVPVRLEGTVHSIEGNEMPHKLIWPYAMSLSLAAMVSCCMQPGMSLLTSQFILSVFSCNAMSTTLHRPSHLSVLLYMSCLLSLLGTQRAMQCFFD